MSRLRLLAYRFQSDRRGFALFEALVAVALMGLILTILATVTAQWMPSWRAGLARMQRVKLLGLGLDRIVADLAAAEFISVSYGSAKPLFEGSPASATFVRTAIGPNGSNGLEIVRLADSEDDQGLVRSRAPFTLVAPGGAGAFEFSDAVKLVRDPFRVSFAFAGRDRAWRDNWSNEAQLPAAVRVTVRNGATDEVLAVSTATLLHIGVPAHCVHVNSAVGCLQELEKSQDPKGR